MKFFCEYCGSRIDSEVDDKCPHCGASYKKNKTFLRMEEEKNKEKQLHNELRQEVVNQVMGTMKTSTSASKIIIVITIVVMLFIFVIGFGNIIKHENLFNFGKEKNVTVDLNEYASTKKYKTKVTKYEVVEDMFGRLQEGYEYVKFYLQVENLTDDQLTKEDVNCIVDGIAQTNNFTSGYSDIPMFIQKGLTVTGTATFAVPKDATSYDIKYGDYITIHIEK